MAVLPPKEQHFFKGLFHSSNRATANGVVDQTTATRLRYWNKWKEFCKRLGVDPYFKNVSDISTRFEHLVTFAAYVREGHAGRGNQVRVGSVQTALCAIGATFELDELPNPLYSQQGLGRIYWKRLDRAINSYKTEDPATSPQLAVPVAITEHLVDKGEKPTSSRKTQAACDLCNIAFYYLLRVG